MRNRIIAVYRIANRLVSITVENPDFSELRVNQFVKIGDKEYRINSLPFVDSTPPKSFFEIHLQLTTQRMNWWIKWQYLRYRIVNHSVLHRNYSNQSVQCVKMYYKSKKWRRWLERIRASCVVLNDLSDFRI